MHVAFGGPIPLVTLLDHERFFCTMLVCNESELNKFPLWIVKKLKIPAFAYDPEYIYLDSDKDIITVTIYYPSKIQMKIAVCFLEYEQKGDQKQKIIKKPTRQDLKQFVESMIIFPQ